MKGRWTETEIRRLLDIVTQQQHLNHPSTARFNWSSVSEHVRSRTPMQCYNKLRYLLYRSPSLLDRRKDDSVQAQCFESLKISATNSQSPMSKPAELAAKLAAARSPAINWTAEDDAAIMEWGQARKQRDVKESSSIESNPKSQSENLSWTILAKRLARTPHSCNQRFARLLSFSDAESSRRSAHWTRIEDSKLLHAFTRSPYDWNDISNQLGRRTAQQCHQRYFALLHMGDDIDDGGDNSKFLNLQDKLLISWIKRKYEHDPGQLTTNLESYQRRYRELALRTNSSPEARACDQAQEQNQKQKLTRRKGRGVEVWSMQEFGHLRQTVAESENLVTVRSEFWKVVQEKMHAAGFPRRTDQAYRYMNYRFSKLFSDDPSVG